MAKKYVAENLFTISGFHHKKIREYNEKKSELPKKKRMLKKLHIKLEQAENDRTANSETKTKLKNKIEKLEIEIDELENNHELKNYMARSSSIVIDYYSNMDSNSYLYDEDDSLIDEMSENENTTQLFSEKLSLINNMKKSKTVKKVRKRRIEPQKNESNLTILDFFGDIDKDGEVDKNELYDKYMTLENKDYSKKKKKVSSYICSKCEIPKVLCQADGCYVCTKCGETEQIEIDSEIPSHKDSMTDKPKYPYKKQNHLKDKLNQLQSKTNISIDNKVIKLIKSELKQKKLNQDNCGPNDIKKILKKYKLSEYYEHTQQIFCIITKTAPIILSKETEDKVIEMFTRMQASFIKNKSKLRTNFLNYSYTLNRIFNLLDMPECSRRFKLLESKGKLKEQDITWRKICNDMGWDYQKSIRCH